MAMDMPPPAMYEVYEIELNSEVEYVNPLWDVALVAHLVAPSGRELQVDGFWDGGRRWLVCVAPDETGSWCWRTECSDETNAGLHERSGEFECRASDAHGPLRIAADQTHLEHADGTPFFWLGDTAWNGVLRATDDDWEEYLSLRAEQGFTAVQFVCTQWRGWPDGEVFIDGERIRPNVEAYQAMDRRVAAIARHGMVPVPVLLWALQPTDPGEALSEENAVRLARYMVARWGAQPVVFLLGGDGRYPDPGALAAHRAGGLPRTARPPGQHAPVRQQVGQRRVRRRALVRLHRLPERAWPSDQDLSVDHRWPARAALGRRPAHACAQH